MSLDKDVRRMLGYHVLAGDGSVDVYARGCMAKPLRDSDRDLAAIRTGQFKPDMTRSGVFAANPAVGCPEQPPAPTNSNCIAETMSSPSACLSSRSSSSSGLENVEDPPAEPSVSGAGVSSLIQEEGKLVCGKPFLLRFEFSSDFNKEARRCQKKFLIGGVVRSLAGGLRSWLLCVRGAGISSYHGCETAWRGRSGEASLKAWLPLIG